MTNTIARNGLVYFPEFCAVVLKKFREEDEEQFAQIMFKVTFQMTLLFNPISICIDAMRNRTSSRIVSGQKIQNSPEISWQV